MFEEFVKNLKKNVIVNISHSTSSYVLDVLKDDVYML